MGSSKKSTGIVAPIITLTVGLVAIATCVALVVTAGTLRQLAGTSVAGSGPIDREDELQFFELEAMDEAPEQWWTLDLSDSDSSAYPSYTTSVDGDPLVYLTSDAGPSGPGGLIRLNSFTGQRKWTANMDSPTSCTPIIRGQYLSCQDHDGGNMRVRYVDLHSGTVTPWLSVNGKISTVTAANTEGTEFLVAVEGPKPGETTVHRGTPTSINSVWTKTFRVADATASLYADLRKQLGTIGYGPKRGDSVTFDLATGEEVPPLPTSYDPDVWRWSDRTTIRIDRARMTFELVDSSGRVVAQGTDLGNHTGITRKVGTARESVALVGRSAYDTTTGAKLWTDARLMRADDDPLNFDRDPTSTINSTVSAIVDDTVVIELRDDFPAGSFIALDLRTGRQLWRKDHRSAPVQRFLDDGHWVSILDDKLQAFDVRTGREVWTVDYPRAAEGAGSFDTETLAKIDGQHLIVTTSKKVTFFGPQ